MLEMSEREKFLFDLQGFLQQCADVLQVSQEPSGVDIALTAVDLVAIETEAVVQNTALVRRRLGETLAQFSERLELALVDLEVRNDGATGIGRGHALGSPSVGGIWTDAL